MSIAKRRFAAFSLVICTLALGSGVGGWVWWHNSSDRRLAGAETGNDQTIVVIDDAGRTITLSTPPKRIAACAAFAVELLMAIDTPPVLRPDVPAEKVHPEAARDIPTLSVQHSSGPDLEAIAAARVDLVILHANFAPFTTAIEKALGVPVLLLEVKSLQDVFNKLELLGRVVGKTETASAAIETLAKAIERNSAHAPLSSPRVLALFGTPDAFYAYRATSYLGSMLTALGADNVAADDTPTPRFQSLAPIDLEEAVLRDPEVIVIVTHGAPVSALDRLSAHPAWKRIRAVRDGRVHQLDEAMFSSNPGPRAPQALRELRTLIYPTQP